ncbi:MAG: hypothetical protein V9G24_00450 [Rhodoblastus sp.]
MRAISVAILSTALLAGGCAKKANDIQANYQDPRRFNSYLCHQLRDAAERVAGVAGEAYDEQNSKSSVAGVITVPKSWFRTGNSSDVVVARAKGDMQAIETASQRKNCGVLFRPGTEGAPPQFTGAKPMVAGPGGTKSIYNSPRF